MSTLKQNKRGVWTVTFKTEHGKRTLDTGTKNKDEAKQIVKEAKVDKLETTAKAVKLTREVVSQIVVGKKVSVQDAYDYWCEWLNTGMLKPKTALNFRVAVNAWITQHITAKRQVNSLTAKDIDAWINNPAWKVKASTKRASLSAISAFFRFCSVRAYIYGDPSGEVGIKYHLLGHEQKEAREFKVFTDEQVQKLLDATAPEGPNENLFWHCAIGLSRYSGLRLSDIATLEWAALGKPGKLIVWTQKRNRRVEHELDLAPELKKILYLIDVNSGPYCFPWHQQIAAEPKSKARLSTMFARLCAKVGIEGMVFHELRHTYITECRNKGIPIPHISALVGHTNTQTTEGYIHEK